VISMGKAGQILNIFKHVQGTKQMYCQLQTVKHYTS